jgi:hypothetical protein
MSTENTSPSPQRGGSIKGDVNRKHLSLSAERGFYKRGCQQKTPLPLRREGVDL